MRTDLQVIAQSNLRGTTPDTMLRILVLIAALVAVALAAPSFYAPLAASYSRYFVPAPYAYHAAPAVYHSVEPVEQHGYQIVY